MTDISIRVNNRLHKSIESTGQYEWSNGTTNIEFETSNDASTLSIYIQKKGFGSKSSKSATAVLDIDTAREAVAFLLKHIELHEKIQRMQNAADAGA